MYFTSQMFKDEKLFFCYSKNASINMLLTAFGSTVVFLSWMNWNASADFLNLFILSVFETLTWILIIQYDC